MSSGTVVLGLINGLLIGLLAIGLVLVYRSNRFINLAHAQLGAIPSLILAKLALDSGWNWWPAALLSIGLGAGIGVLVDWSVVSRIRRKTSGAVPLLLASIGVTDLLLALTYVKGFNPNQDKLDLYGYPVPFVTHLRVGGVILSGQYVMILVFVPLFVAALAAYLRYSFTGKMIRGAASNPDVARLCGISTTAMSRVSWAIAGGLSAITAILQAPSEGNFNAATLGPELLLLSLGASAFGGFVSIPGALAGGLLIGLARQLTAAGTGSAGTADLVVFLLIMGIVLIRSRAIGAAFAGQSVPVDDRPPARVPERIAGRPLVRYRAVWMSGAPALFALLLPVLPYFRSTANRFDLTLVVVFAITGVALTMVVGWAGQISLGHFALVGVGAFLTARLASHGWNFTVVLVVAGLGGALAMVIVGLPALRVRGLTLAVTTLGLAIVAPEWLFSQNWFGTSSSAGLDVKPLGIGRGLGHPSSMLSIYYVGLIVLAAAIVAARGLRSSGPGRMVIAVRDNERAARSFGVTPVTVKLAVLATSGAIAAMGGVIWADAWQSATQAHFDPYVSLSILAVPVIGGLGSVAGAVAASTGLYMLTYFVAPNISVLGTFATIIFQLALGGLLVVVVLVAYPSGIAGAGQHVWERFLQRIDDSLPPERKVGPEPLPLSVTGVTLSFGGHRALTGAAIEVHRSEIVGLIGPNGAGKTTLINAIAGIYRPDDGSIRLFGEEMTGLPSEFRLGHGLARSFQDANLFPGLTVLETVQLALGYRQRIGFVSAITRAPWARRTNSSTAAEARDVLERLGLSGYAHSLTSELSTGTRRICDLAAQVACRPKVLLLDEPTAGVAQREAEMFGPLLRRIRDEVDCSILVVEHDMPLLMGLCDRVYAMESGAVIAEGTPEEIRANPRVIAVYLGTDESAINRSGTPTGSAPTKAGARRKATAVKAAARKVPAQKTAAASTRRRPQIASSGGDI